MVRHIGLKASPSMQKTIANVTLSILPLGFRPIITQWLRANVSVYPAEGMIKRFNHFTILRHWKFEHQCQVHTVLSIPRNVPLLLPGTSLRHLWVPTVEEADFLAVLLKQNQQQKNKGWNLVLQERTQDSRSSAGTFNAYVISVFSITALKTGCGVLRNSYYYWFCLRYKVYRV